MVARELRVPVLIAGELSGVPGRITDLSTGGFKFRTTEDTSWAPNDRVVLRFGEFVFCAVVRWTHDGIVGCQHLAQAQNGACEFCKASARLSRKARELLARGHVQDADNKIADAISSALTSEWVAQRRAA